MIEPRWADGLLPEQPQWVRDLIEEELNKRETRIKELEAVAEAAIATHEVDAHARKNQATHWKNYAMDALANALRAAGYLRRDADEHRENSRVLGDGDDD